MEYRKLGKSGLKVAEIGLGGNNFGMRLGETDSIAVIRHALDAGINFIDSADMYGQGKSEELVGKAVKGKRQDVIIATKFAFPTGEGPNDRGASRYYIIKAVEASLKRLDTDYIDLYYVHRPDTSTPIEETLRTMDNLVRSGKVRYIGCSNFAGWQLAEAMWTSRVNNLESFVVLQSQYSLLERSVETEVIPCCLNFGVGFVPYSPLASGFLTGKYERGKPAPAGSRLDSMQTPPTRPASASRTPMPSGRSPFGGLLTDANFDKLEKWQGFAKAHGHTVEELAIAWLLSHSYLSSVIAGATKPEQIDAHVEAAKWKLTATELAEFEKLAL